MRREEEKACGPKTTRAQKKTMSLSRASEEECLQTTYHQKLYICAKLEHQTDVTSAELFDIYKYMEQQSGTNDCMSTPEPGMYCRWHLSSSPLNVSHVRLWNMLCHKIRHRMPSDYNSKYHYALNVNVDVLQPEHRHLLADRIQKLHSAHDVLAIVCHLKKTYDRPVVEEDDQKQVTIDVTALDNVDVSVLHSFLDRCQLWKRHYSHMEHEVKVAEARKEYARASSNNNTRVRDDNLEAAHVVATARLGALIGFRQHNDDGERSGAFERARKKARDKVERESERKVARTYAVACKRMGMPAAEHGHEVVERMTSSYDFVDEEDGTPQEDGTQDEEQAPPREEDWDFGEGC